MPVTINKDLCIGCGACVGVCPVNALEMSDDGKIICKETDCIDCEACVSSCPTEAISN